MKYLTAFGLLFTACSFNPTVDVAAQLGDGDGGVSVDATSAADAGLPVDGAIDAPMDAANSDAAIMCGSDDGDTDGIMDLCDNCPSIMNPGQEDGDIDGIGDACDSCPGGGTPDGHDEDSDGLDDACDNCPGIANPNQADTTETALAMTADGVGDACDPRPGSSLESITLFDALEDASLDATHWTGNGTITVANGYAEMSGFSWFESVASYDDVMIMANIEHVEGSRATVWVSGGQGDEYDCHYRRDSNGTFGNTADDTGELILKRYDGGGIAGDTLSLSPTGRTYRLGAKRVANTDTNYLECWIQDVAALPGALDTAIDGENDELATGSVGVWSPNGGVLRIHSVTVVTSTAP